MKSICLEAPVGKGAPTLGTTNLLDILPCGLVVQGL